MAYIALFLARKRVIKSCSFTSYCMECPGFNRTRISETRELGSGLAIAICFANTAIRAPSGAAIGSLGQLRHPAVLVRVNVAPPAPPPERPVAHGHPLHSTLVTARSALVQALVTPAAFNPAASLLLLLRPVAGRAKFKGNDR